MKLFQCAVFAVAAATLSDALAEEQEASVASVPDLLTTLDSRDAPDTQRIDALRAVSVFLSRSDVDVAVKQKILTRILMLMQDQTPAAVTIAATTVLRTFKQPWTIKTIAVACDAVDRTRDVRLAAMEAVTEIGGVAAIPTLIAALDDKDREVAAGASRLLEHLCWTPAENPQPTARWRAFFSTLDGERMLVASLAKLRCGVGGVRSFPSRGLPAQVAQLVLDSRLGDEAWKEALAYLLECVGKDLEVDPKSGRAGITSAVREWWIATSRK